MILLTHQIQFSTKKDISHARKKNLTVLYSIVRYCSIEISQGMHILAYWRGRRLSEKRNL